MTDRIDSREQLLDAVEQILGEKGVRELSLREVARRAGVSHASPGHHFGDKEGMLAAFARRGFAMLGEMMAESALRAGSDPTHRFVEDGKTYVLFAVKHKVYFDVMFRSDLDKTRHPDLDEAAFASFDGLRRGVQGLQSSGRLAGVETDLLTLYFWSMAHGLASLWADDQIQAVFKESDPEQMVDAVLTLGVDQTA